MYLFDNDYENALDKCGKPMLEKFAYDEGGLIVLEVVYILLLYSSNILVFASFVWVHSIILVSSYHLLVFIIHFPPFEFDWVSMKDWCSSSDEAK